MHPQMHRSRESRAMLSQPQQPRLTGTVIRCSDMTPGTPSNAIKCCDTQDSPYLSPITSLPWELERPWRAPPGQALGDGMQGWVALLGLLLFSLFNAFRKNKE